jgi:hypothetical protein
LIDHLLQDDLFGACLDVIHFSSPLEWVISLQSFVYASFSGKARDYGVEYFVSLQVYLVEIFI